MTGQLFLRDTGKVIEGRKVYMIVGIVGMDEVEAMSYPNESQYTVTNIDMTDPIDRKAEARGCNTDNLLRMPIWRV